MFITNCLPDDSGTWSKYYEFQFYYGVYCKHYLYAQTQAGSKRNYIIHELKHGGKMGPETTHGGYNLRYESIFPYSIGDKQYYFRHTTKRNAYFTQVLLPNGKVGRQITDSSFESPFQVLFPFWIDGRQFFYGQRKNDFYYFTRELFANGRVAKEDVAHGKLDRFYDIQFAFSMNRTHYFYGQSKKDKQFTIKMLNSNGKVGPETDHGHLSSFGSTQFPFHYEGKQYIYIEDGNSTYTAEVTSMGKLQPRQRHSDLTHHYMFPYTIDNVVYFYGQEKNKDWVITTFVM